VWWWLCGKDRTIVVILGKNVDAAFVICLESFVLSCVVFYVLMFQRDLPSTIQRRIAQLSALLQLDAPTTRTSLELWAAQVWPSKRRTKKVHEVSSTKSTMSAAAVSIAVGVRRLSSGHPSRGLCAPDTLGVPCGRHDSAAWFHIGGPSIAQQSPITADALHHQHSSQRRPFHRQSRCCTETCSVGPGDDIRVNTDDLRKLASRI
jgi:hypothetical protein